MRKVLSIVLVLALVLGSFSFALAAPMSDVKGEKYEDAVNVLTELGVVNGYPDGTYKPANIVTRGEMAKIVICALGLDDYAAGSSSFSDMAGHWADKYVAYAVSLGIINGYPDGTFKPDNTVTYDEAAKMLVAALGYTEDALVGSWPVNWVTKARVLGILDGVKAGSAGANRGDIALMAFQTLNQQIGKTNKDGDFVPTNLGTQAAPEDDTMLGRLGAEVKAGGAFVLTDGDAASAIVNVRDYVGAFVTAYVNDDDEIIAIKEVKSTFLSGEVKVANLGVAGSKFKADGVEYVVERADYDNTTVTPIVSNVVAKEFTNGKDNAVGVLSAFAAGTELTLAVKLSGKYIKEIYSISEWKLADGSHFMFEDGDLDWDDALLGGEQFDTDDNDEIVLESFELVGVDSLEEIKEDHVVYVYNNGGAPKTGLITRVEVGTEVVTGEITKVKGAVKDLTSEYTIGGKVYEIAAQQATGKFTIGDFDVESEVTVYLDVNGDIYGEELVKKDADNFAVILETANGVEGLGGKDALVRMFLADETEDTFVAVEKDVDDAFLKKTAGAPDTLDWVAGATGASAGNIVKYGVNDKGEIDTMDVAIAGGFSVVGAGTAYSITKAGYIDGYKIADDAYIVTVPDMTAFSDDADDYGITTRDKVLGLDVTARYKLEDGLVVLMVMEATATSDQDLYGMYLGKATKSGDPGFEVEMLVDGSAETYGANSTAHGKIDTPATSKDLLQRIVFDVNGNVKDLELPTAYAGAGKDVNIITYDGTGANKVIMDVTNNVAEETNAATITKSNDYDAAQTTVSISTDVVVYKIKDGEWVKGSVSDLKINGKAVIVTFYDIYGDDKVADVVTIK